MSTFKIIQFPLNMIKLGKKSYNFWIQHINSFSQTWHYLKASIAWMDIVRLILHVQKQKDVIMDILVSMISVTRSVNWVQYVLKDFSVDFMLVFLTYLALANVQMAIFVTKFWISVSQISFALAFHPAHLEQIYVRIDIAIQF